MEFESPSYCFVEVLFITATATRLEFLGKFRLYKFALSRISSNEIIKNIETLPFPLLFLCNSNYLPSLSISINRTSPRCSFEAGENRDKISFLLFSKQERNR